MNKPEMFRDDTGTNIDKLFRLDGKVKRRRKRIETQLSDDEHRDLMRICQHYGASSAAVLRVAFNVALPTFESNREDE